MADDQNRANSAKSTQNNTSKAILLALSPGKLALL